MIFYPSLKDDIGLLVILIKLAFYSNKFIRYLTEKIFLTKRFLNIIIYS